MTTIHQLPLPLDAPRAETSATADAPARLHVPNASIAHALDRAAAMLEERGANEHRVASYRRAAETVRDWPEALDRLARTGGAVALEALPGVGERLARRIAAFVETGELSLLRELREAMPPERLFTRITGIGRTSARQIVDALGVETLEALEVAAHDGRLADLPGFGAAKVRSVRAQLDALLAGHTRRDVRAALRPPRAARTALPRLADLLDVDDEYRERASRGELPTIAPRRFNEADEAWLPILAHPPRRAPPHRRLLQHAARPHARQDERLGGALRPERRGRARAAAHRRHRDARRPARTAGDPRPRGRLPRASTLAPAAAPRDDAQSPGGRSRSGAPRWGGCRAGRR